MQDSMWEKLFTPYALLYATSSTILSQYNLDHHSRFTVVSERKATKRTYIKHSGTICRDSASTQNFHNLPPWWRLTELAVFEE
jgi:hypothetical protein